MWVWLDSSVDAVRDGSRHRGTRRSGQQFRPRPDGRPFLEIGLDLIWHHLQSANSGANIFLAANGPRPAGVYTIQNLDAYMMVLRFQKNILP